MKPGIYLLRSKAQDRTVILAATNGNGVVGIAVDDNEHDVIASQNSYADTKRYIANDNGTDSHLMYIPFGDNLVVDDNLPVVRMGEDIIDFINEN